MSHLVEHIQKIWDIITSLPVMLAEYALGLYAIFLVIKAWRTGNMSARSLSLLAVCFSILLVNTLSILDRSGAAHLPWTMVVKINTDKDVDIISIPHKNDKKNDRSVVFMTVETNRRLKNAAPFLKSIYPFGQNPSAQMTERSSAQTMLLGWYDGSRPFERRPISTKDSFVIFNIFNYDHRLSLFTNTDAVEKNNFYRAVPPGSYVVVVQIDDETLTSGIEQKFKINWNGKDSDGFAIEKCDSC